MAKTLKIVLLVLLIVAIISGVVVGAIYLSKRFKTPQADSSEDSLIAISSEGEAMYVGETYEMPKAMTIVAAAQAESQYAPGGEFIIKATLSNVYLNNIFDFTVDFIDSTDSWATGKDASDYISVTPVSVNQAEVKFIKTFSSPIEIKAQVVGTQHFNTCKVDCLAVATSLPAIYLAELEGQYFPNGSASFDYNAYDFGDNGKITIISCFARYSGTVVSKYVITDCTLSLKSDFIENLKNYLSFDITFKELNVQAPIDSIYYRDFGTDPSGYKNDGYEFEIGELEYSTFIENFDSFNEQQKQAIYFAWYAAYKNYGTFSNIEIRVDHMQRCYLNTVLNDISLGVVRYPRAAITGAKYGEDAVPDIEFNGNIVF